MKGKYYQALFFTGVLPVLLLAGAFLWSALNNPAPGPKGGPGASAQAGLDQVEAQVRSVASSLSASVKRTNEEAPTLTGNHSDEALAAFVTNHPGVRGLSVFTKKGLLGKSFPANAPALEASYGTTDEFQGALGQVEDGGKNPYIYFAQSIGYPALLFVVPLGPDGVAAVVFDFGHFFKGLDLKGGEAFILGTGNSSYFYHSDPSKLFTPFNPGQEPWLEKVRTDLANGQAGSTLRPGAQSAVYAPVAFASSGIVQIFPSSALAPAAPAPPPGLAGLPDYVKTSSGMILLIAIAVALGLVFILGSAFASSITGPARKAAETVLAAANGSGSLTPEVAARFGKDEVGRMVQAAASLLDKVNRDKQTAAAEAEEALRKGKAQLEEKGKEAEKQVATAQQQAQSVRNELNEKNQVLNDKLRELDALKGMSEGLRAQSEQAKAENAKLRTQITLTEEATSDLKKKVVETQGRLIEMESKMLQTVAAASAIQVSQVRAAAIRTMADELKTTLGIIKGYVSSALGTQQGGINEKQQEFLGMVINRSARLEKFINDLLDIYQVEIEQAEAKHEEVNLASEIEGLAFNFQTQAEVKAIKIKVEAKPGLPKVPIVRRRFNQLWNILYLQVIKDAPRNSSITIPVEPIGDSVKVTVPDPGLTVAVEALPKLFDEFYDPKHPASPQLAGTGLKFALIKTILAAHGGGAVAEKAAAGTNLTLTFSTKVKKPGVPSIPLPTAPKAAGPAVTPSGAPVAAPASGPKITIPGLSDIGKPLAPGAPKPAPSAGALDSLLAGKVPPVTAPGIKPAAAPAPVPPAAPPKPAVPGAPAPPPPALRPPMPAAPGALDSLLDKKPAAPSPAVPAPAPPSPSPLSGGLEALLEKRSAPTVPPAPAPGGMPSALKPPSLGSLSPSAPAPAAPSAPVVPNSLKPTAPPPGILNMENQDSFKVEVPGAPKPPVVPSAAPKPPVPGAPPPPAAPKPPLGAPGMPPPGAPKPPSPLPPPGVPPGGLNASKPMVKDLNKEGEGDLIE